LHRATPLRPADVLVTFLEGVRTAVPPARWVSVTWRAPDARAPSTPAATGEPARAADEMQYSAGEGPCLEAGTGLPVLATGPELARRWPGFGAAVLARTPVRAVLSHPLPGAPVLGSINFYAEVPTSFGTEALRGAAEAAAAGSVVLAGVTARAHADNLEQALTSSRQIAAAIGVIMAQSRCTYDEAFAQIRAASQRTHRKMRDLAEEILFTGALPEAAGA
jgi:hypothetical protein